MGGRAFPGFAASVASRSDNGALGRGWENILREEHLAVCDPVVEVDTKGSDGGSAGGRASDEPGAVPAKVQRPFLAARVKQPSDLFRLGFWRSDLCHCGLSEPGGPWI
jgi:hypothetical protein